MISGNAKLYLAFSLAILVRKIMPTILANSINSSRIEHSISVGKAPKIVFLSSFAQSQTEAEVKLRPLVIGKSNNLLYLKDVWSFPVDYSVLYTNHSK